MPRPEQVIAQAPEGAPHGSTAALQRFVGAVPSPRQPEGPVQLPPEAFAPPQLTNDLNGGLDGELFGPSRRPNEPVTHGAPFGPGADFTPLPQETDRAFMLRVADDLTQSPAATNQTKKYLARIRLGE